MKHIKYLLFTFVLFLGLIFSVSAISESDLTQSKTDNKTTVTYSKLFENKDDARTSLKEFKEYMENRNGKVLLSKIDNVIDTINNEILTSSIEVNDVSELEEKINELQNSYDLNATEERSCKVIPGEIETIVTPEITYEHESGNVGEYNNYIIARSIARMMEYFNNRPDYAYSTDISSETRLTNTFIRSINETYDNPFLANLRRLMLAGFGFDVSDIEVQDRIVTDTTYEIQEFESVAAKNAYKESLENNGYRVEDELIDIAIRTDVNDERSVDETFDSITALNDYQQELHNNYNHIVNQNIEDNSYDEIVDSTVIQGGFSSEEAANDYLDQVDADNDFMVSRNVESYDEMTTTSENIAKYFSDENSANAYLERLNGSLESNQRLENTNVRKMSALEIDINDILDKGDMSLSNNNRSFTFSNINILSTNVYIGNRIETGTVTINNVLVNGISYSKLSIENINNNSTAKITGTVSYCSERGFLNMCRNRVTKEFTSEGIINEDKNAAILGLFTFRYNIDNIIVNNNDVIVNDNLVKVYKVETTKITETINTYYKATANVRNKIRRSSYRYTADVSNIINTPIMIVRFVKYSDHTVYDLIGDAKYYVYNTFYIVNYNAIRTVRSRKITYKQDYRVIETVNNISYLASAEGEIEDSIPTSVETPNTGIKEYYDISLILLLVSALVASISTHLVLKNNK